MECLTLRDSREPSNYRSLLDRLRGDADRQTITLLRPHPDNDGRRRAGKTFRRNDEGAVVGERAPHSFLYGANIRDIYDIEHLLEILREAAARRETIVVNGRPKDGEDPAAFRRIQENMDDVPTYWTLADLDDVPNPDLIDPVADPNAAIDHLKSFLPPEIADADLIVHWSSSTSVFGLATLSAHIIFMHTEPLDSANRQFVLDRCNTYALQSRDLSCGMIVDPSTGILNQELFVADPEFGKGVEDPFKDADRWHLIPGHGPVEIDVLERQLDSEIILPTREDREVRRVEDVRPAPVPREALVTISEQLAEMPDEPFFSGALEPWVPRKPAYGYRKDQHIIRSDRELAMRAPYLQPQHSDYYIKFLVIDIDDGVIDEEALERSLPPYNALSATPVLHPTFGLTMPANPHVIFVLKEAVKPKESPAHYAYFERVRRALIQKARAEGLKVDPRMPRKIKNPDSGTYITRRGTDHEYTLDELAECGGLDPEDREQVFGTPGRCPTADAPQERFQGHSRNCDTFDSVRYFAYAQKALQSSYEGLFDAVLAQAVEVNKSFPTPMSYAEVRGVAKSIARWTWKNYEGAGAAADVNRGIMTAHFHPSMTTEERQQASQARTSKIRVNASLEAIKKAVEKLQEQGLEVTKKGVSRISGKSLNTVRKHWETVTRIASDEAVKDRGVISVSSGSACVDARPQAQEHARPEVTEDPQPNTGQQERRPTNKLAAVEGGEVTPSPRDLADYISPKEFDSEYRAAVAVKEGRMSPEEFLVLLEKHEAARIERWRTQRKPRWRFANDQREDFSDEPCGDGSDEDRVWNLRAA